MKSFVVSKDPYVPQPGWESYVRQITLATVQKLNHGGFHIDVAWPFLKLKDVVTLLQPVCGLTCQQASVEVPPGVAKGVTVRRFADPRLTPQGCG